MAVADIHLRDLGFGVLAIIAVLYFYQRFIAVHMRPLRKRFGAWMCNKMMWRVHSKVSNEKRQLFQKLDDQRNKVINNLDILEIGIGPGSNFDHIPAGSHLSCLDPNPEHKKYVEQNLKKNAHNVKLVKYVVGFAEDMVEFGDNTFDSVISTFTLCSVQNPERCLREIKRVLKPGGIFYFMEHVAAPESSYLLKVQRCLQIIWHSLSKHGHLTRETSKTVQNAGFSSVNITNFKFTITIFAFCKFGIFGTAQK